MRRLLGIFGIMLLLALLLASAAAQEAREITELCAFSSNQANGLRRIGDRNYHSNWTSLGGIKARLDISAPEGETIGGVYIKFFNDGSPFDLLVQDAEGDWQIAAQCETDYLAGFAALPEGARAVRVVPGGEEWGKLSITELYVFSPGELPEWVQRWEAPFEKADMLVLSTHPDDELLFMGGTIPYYTAERGKAVQVAYLVPATPYRKLELLDGLWLCGVRHYPDLGPFADVYSPRASTIYKRWSREKLERHIVSLYRHYQPEVVVAQDVNGEYGHGAHKAGVETARGCIALAVDPAYQDQRLDETQPWQIKKLYLHLFPEGALEMDWRQPLEAFGGKTAFEVAEAAFQCHVSQLGGSYAVRDSGAYSCAKFGLAFTCVGEDVEKNDFLEHIE